jgi:SAM-dependent methyltransferase
MANHIHPAAARGFQIAPDAYERGRPDYPADAVAHLTRVLDLGPGMTVVDLGAGTGKFTRLLRDASGATVIAVEPVAAMRDKLGPLHIQVLDGTAEHIPLADGSVDAVVAAQAFHWFDGAAALAEIRRVLKPKTGKLGLIWNARDEQVCGWGEQLSSIIEVHEHGAPRYKSGAWKKVFDCGADFGFSPLEYAQFQHVHPCTPETVVDRVASISFIAALPDDHKQTVLNDVRQLLATIPATRGKDTVELAYRTDVWWCHVL